MAGLLWMLALPALLAVSIPVMRYARYLRRRKEQREYREGEKLWRAYKKNLYGDDRD